MKIEKIKIGLALTIALTFTAVSVPAQVVTTNASGGLTTTTGTNSPATTITPANFFGTVQSYLTSVDTNFDWTSNRLELAAGGDYIGGLEWANYVSGQYDFGRWDLESKIRNVGVAGAIESVEGGGGYTVIQDYSLKLQGSLLVGYDFDRSAVLIEPQAVLKKKGTRNTYLELGIGVPLWLQKPLNDRPNIFIGAGFTY
jgi:hypothetical protein